MNFGLKIQGRYDQTLPLSNYILIYNVVPWPHIYTSRIDDICVNPKSGIDVDSIQCSKVIEKLPPTGKFIFKILINNILESTSVYLTLDGKTYGLLAKSVKVKLIPLLKMYLDNDQYRLNIIKTEDQSLPISNKTLVVLRDMLTIKSNVVTSIAEYISSHGLESIQNKAFDDYILPAFGIEATNNSISKARGALISIKVILRIRREITYSKNQLVYATIQDATNRAFKDNRDLFM